MEFIVLGYGVKLRMNINFDKSLKNQLVKSLELEKYQWIIENVQTIDISDNTKFQKAYDGFYNVRRNETWRKIYFNYFQEIRLDFNITFEIIIKALNERLPNASVEPSFSSKMLATLNTQMPIWDSKVLKKWALIRNG